MTTRFLSLQKRTEILDYKGLYDCSKNIYPKSAQKGDFYICIAPTYGEMPDGECFAVADYMVFNGDKWDKIKSTQIYHKYITKLKVRFYSQYHKLFLLYLLVK